MKYEEKVLSVIVITAFLIMLALFGYRLHQEMENTKPHLSIGTCVTQDLSNEFEKHEYNTIIVKVGKERYQTYVYGKNDQVYAYGFLETHSFSYLERISKKVPCMPHLELIKKIKEARKQ